MLDLPITHSPFPVSIQWIAHQFFSEGEKKKLFSTNTAVGRVSSRQRLSYQQNLSFCTNALLF